ncbi:MAG: preprotein translocase subunit SecA [Sphingobacteriales bacterium]|nr:MAG: preprotein translocase subunit SecA [Sphingobacteriales bacterium]
MIGFLSKIFGGSKSEKDMKPIRPLVEQINSYYAQYAELSNDALRGKTTEFRSRIADYLAQTDTAIADARSAAEAAGHGGSDAQYATIDKLRKERNARLEEILKEILPEAFAVVKETARRFSEHAELEATATELDQMMAPHRPNVRLEGDRAFFANTWDAAGSTVTWNMVHYDVQLIGGIVLHDGKIAEMATGEGKTLVSTLPSYLNALAGEGVHVVTVNDYLARRDQEWNGPLFEFLGLTTDCIDKHQPNSPQRRNAYMADITYGTNNEFGFDYLRDNMVHHPSEKVQRAHHYAMVDEVDSVLVDDARTPLIISGPVARGDEQQFHALKPRIEALVAAQRAVVNQSITEAKKLLGEGKTDKETGGLALYRAQRGLPKNSALIKLMSEEGVKQIAQKTENYYLGEQQRHMPKVDAELFFSIDEKSNSVDLTSKGIELITGNGEDPDFFVLPDISTGLHAIDTDAALTPEEKAQHKDALLQDYATKTDRIHSVQQLLKAYTLFDKDVEYVVMDGKVMIVDEQTGRILDGRRYSDGLHQAIEAKENVQVEAATQTFATITLQNYFRMYHKLCGMTGTAETEAGEFWEIYKLDVVSIPTNRPISRNDQQDLVYKTKREKYGAVIEEVIRLQEAGRPVLVGTTSVEVSELLAKMLSGKKIQHNVLNAKQHAREAQIVAEAGLPGAVTIATNMAGRGTDIKLGPGVKESGGLAIIGTERHDSRRVDRQLRGRAGRQGDPGSSQFFVSLEDDLMRLFGSERIAALMDRMGHKDGEVLQHSMITRSIERAQKKVEENNFGIRKRLLEYDDVMNAQRKGIYERRNHALYGERLALDIDQALFHVCEDLGTQGEGSRDYEGFKLLAAQMLAIDPQIDEATFNKAKAAEIAESLYQDAREVYDRKFDQLREGILPTLQQILQENGPQVGSIAIPFTDGVRGMQVGAELSEAVENEARPVITALEKGITLSLIDEGWKDHLRAMDDLRHSVQTASFEQKDPLLIYKFEAFKLYQQMLLDTDRTIVSFLMRAGIPMQEAPHEVMQSEQIGAPEAYGDYYTNEAEVEAAGQDYAANEQDYYNPREIPETKREPVTADPKIGRNDPCPCGSGKKYKNCHGA